VTQAPNQSATEFLSVCGAGAWPGLQIGKASRERPVVGSILLRSCLPSNLPASLAGEGARCRDRRDHRLSSTPVTASAGTIFVQSLAVDFLSIPLTAPVFR
jgi:hypothetical protein